MRDHISSSSFHPIALFILVNLCAGQDLVPEPQVQDQEGHPGEGDGRLRPHLQPPPGGRARPGQGRTGLLRRLGPVGQARRRPPAGPRPAGRRPRRRAPPRPALRPLPAAVLSPARGGGRRPPRRHLVRRHGRGGRRPA